MLILKNNIPKANNLFSIKKGTEIYRGKVAPLNGHPGGGDKIFVTGDNLEKILLPALD